MARSSSLAWRPEVPSPAHKSVECFGEYRLVRYLTAGGMADLYLARNPRWDRLLVVKRIQPRYLDRARVVKMFIDEGRIAQVLDHPNIVRTLDVGNLDGQYYIAMEYIPGYDLIAIVRRAIETGRFLPQPVALGIVNQIATGLAFAHSRIGGEGAPLRIVHCDISPGNIVVSLRGTAKIVDFGIARATIALREEHGVAGKYSYMAPEQIRGEEVDARADLFSLGVILYELTVGKRLFRGRPEAVIRKVCEDPIPRPRDVRADYPAELEHILAHLLARDPAQRYPSAAALRSDLRNYLQSLGGGWSKRDIGSHLNELFRAPKQLADADDLRAVEQDEKELGRAMPPISDDSMAVATDRLEEPSEPLSAAFNQHAPEPDAAAPLPVALPPLSAVSASVASLDDVSASGSEAGAAIASQPAAETKPRPESEPEFLAFVPPLERLLRRFPRLPAVIITLIALAFAGLAAWAWLQGR